MINIEVFHRDALIDFVRSGVRPKFLFFWRHTSDLGTVVGKHCLSQWFPAPFVLDGVTYRTAEHHMMAEKARLFDDESTRARVLAADHPGEAKELGREVQGFDEERWADARFDIVVRGNDAKFEQHPRLAAYLASTGSRVLVEASPQDRVWGIGLAETDADAEDPERWEGLNLLGFALMTVRARLPEL